MTNGADDPRAGALATDVLVIGAGPTGLTAAAEALRHGLSVRIVDKSAARTTFSKALVAHSRTLDIFTDMGFAPQVLARGKEFRALNIYARDERIARVVFAELDWHDAAYPCWLSIPQSDTEACLEEHLERRGGRVERQTELLALEQHPDFVRATLRRGSGQVETCDAAWLIGCDGARSAVRKQLEIAYEGTAEDELFILADVKMAWHVPEDEGQNYLAADGILLVVPMPEPQQWRVIAHMPKLGAEDAVEVTRELLQALLRERTGHAAQIHEVGWTSHFTVKHFLAAQHRKGRAFLAGDAAHAHSPVGGQGMNTGIQDAYNLLWKLALFHKGQASDKLLDSYHAERHEIAAATLKNIHRATTLLTLENPLSQVLRNQLAGVLINTAAGKQRLGPGVGMLNLSYQGSPAVAEPAQPLAQRLLRRLGGGDGVDFDAGPGAGDRAPNVTLAQPGGDQRLLDLLCGGQHTLLLFLGLDAAQADALVAIAAKVRERYAAPIRPLLVLPGAQSAPPGWDGATLRDQGGQVHRRYGASGPCLYLIRPDHHVAFRSQPADLAALTSLIGHLDTLLTPRPAR